MGPIGTGDWGLGLGLDNYKLENDGLCCRFLHADNTIFPPLTIDKNCFLFQQKDLLVVTTLDSGEQKQYIDLSLKAEQNFSNYVL